MGLETGRLFRQERQKFYTLLRDTSLRPSVISRKSISAGLLTLEKHLLFFNGDPGPRACYYVFPVCIKKVGKEKGKKSLPAVLVNDASKKSKKWTHGTGDRCMLSTTDAKFWGSNCLSGHSTFIARTRLNQTLLSWNYADLDSSYVKPAVQWRSLRWPLRWSDKVKGTKKLV